MQHGDSFTVGRRRGRNTKLEARPYTKVIRGSADSYRLEPKFWAPTLSLASSLPPPPAPYSAHYCMDAHGLLTRQGWLGDGHSLDHTGRGIKKPLLVSKKVDVLGLGVNRHAAVSDQWWLKAFDQGLKDLGSGKESLLANVQKLGVKRGGLYGRFVRGEGMSGTIGSAETSGISTPVEIADTVQDAVTGSKRKREWEDGGSEERKAKRASKTEKVERQEAKRAAKRQSQPESTEDGAERKAARKAKKAEKETRLAQKEAAKAEAATKKAARRARKKAMVPSTASQPATSDGDDFRIHEGTSMLDGDEKGESVPGGSAVERCPTKAEKRALKAESAPKRAELSRKIEKLSSEKRARYEKRAAEKGISLQLYMIQRQEKSAAKKT